MIKGIIFDLDGTLLDTIADLGEACNRVLKDYHRELYSMEKYQQFVGNGMRTLVDRAFQHQLNEAALDQALQAFKEHYSEVYLDQSKPYEGVNDTLKELQRRGILLGVCTNKNDGYVRPLLEKYLPEIDFEYVLGEKGDGLHKPNPQGPLLIAHAMGLDPQEILFVGDSDVDIQTAKNANMIASGVSWGFRSVEELKKEGAQYIVDHPSKWLDIIELDN